MKVLLCHIFIESLFKKTVLSVEKLCTFSYTFGREARQITFMWGEISSSYIIETYEWFCLSAFSLPYFRLVSFVQVEKLHICHHNTVVIWTPCENTDSLLASFQHGSTGWGVLQTYSLLPHRKFFNKTTWPPVDRKLRTCISQGVTDKMNNHVLGDSAKI